MGKKTTTKTEEPVENKNEQISLSVDNVNDIINYAVRNDLTITALVSFIEKTGGKESALTAKGYVEGFLSSVGNETFLKLKNEFLKSVIVKASDEKKDA